MLPKLPGIKENLPLERMLVNEHHKVIGCCCQRRHYIKINRFIFRTNPFEFWFSGFQHAQ